MPLFGDDWCGVAHALTKLAKTGECYARIGDEYGTNLYFSRNDQNKTYNFWNQDDGDEEEDEDVNTAQLAAWEQSIPGTVRSAFPDLVAQDNDE